MFRMLVYCGLYFLSSLVSAEFGNRTTTNFLVNEVLPSVSQPDHVFKYSNSECTFDMDTGLFNGSDSLRVRCCRFVYQQSKSNWIFDEMRLSDLLRTLRLWRCIDFERECRLKTFAFTDFTKLVYLRFCDEAQYVTECHNSLQSVVSVHLNRKHVSASFIQTSDNDASVHEFNGSTSFPMINPETIGSTSLALHQRFLNMDRENRLELKEREMPCVQSVLIDVVNSSFGTYFEMIDYYVPFCEIVWCGFTDNSFRYYNLSYWNCLPNRCRTRIIVYMVVVALMSLLTTVANAAVLIVFAKNRKLRDSQGIYKISLACGDLLTGLFVLPTMIQTLRIWLWSRRYERVRSSFLLYGGGKNRTWIYTDASSQSYINFCGFFTGLTFYVTTCTLLAASFDRFRVVYRPMHYNIYWAKTLAIRISMAIWIVSIALSVIPIIAYPVLRYNQSLMMVIIYSSASNLMLILYGVLLLAPLVLTWIINACMLIFTRRNSKARQATQGERFNKTVEFQLAKTLAIMVVVFSVCFLPLLISIVVTSVIGGIRPLRLDSFDQSRFADVNSFEYASALLVMSNSLWNFFIYNVRSREFRIACYSLHQQIKSRLKSACRFRRGEDPLPTATYVRKRGSSQAYMTTMSSQASNC